MDAYRDASRRDPSLPSARLVTATSRLGHGVLASYELARGTAYVIGRRPGCGSRVGDQAPAEEMIIPIDTIARLHALIEPYREGWTVIDMKSTCGVYVNEELVRKERTLREGDRVRLGTLEVVFRQDPT